MQVDWIQWIEGIYKRANEKVLHIDQIVDLALEFGQVPPGFNGEEIKKKINSVVSANARKKTPQFARVRNTKTKKFRKGVYRLKPQPSFELTPETAPSVSTQFTGAAGEYAVMSELLFRGYNASKMTVDDGIDLVASKENAYFHIQVKTANERAGRTYQASIRTKSFQHTHNTFYIIVMRTLGAARYHNDYVVFPSSKITELISRKILKEGSQSISLKVSIENGRYLLAGTEDVSHLVNDFTSIR